MRWSNLSACVFIFLMIAGCSDPTRQESLQEMAHSVWSRHEDIIQRALGGRSVSENDLDSSLSFFAETAGIVIVFDHTPVGDVPIARTREDVERVRRWYSSNSSRLYWDEAKERVRIRAPLDPVGRAWWQHESTVIRLFSGEKPSAKEVADSQIFFLELTGIHVPADPALGTPGKGTPEALESIREWYKLNQQRLYVDRATGRVKLQRS